jgi:hypothetical protein
MPASGIRSSIAGTSPANKASARVVAAACKALAKSKGVRLVNGRRIGGKR